jgi:hypothetical protein
MDIDELYIRSEDEDMGDGEYFINSYVRVLVNILEIEE